MTRAWERVRALWCAWWFRPGSLLDLGIARSVLALIVLELNGVMRFWSVGLVAPELWKPLPWIAALGFDQPPTLRELIVYGQISRAALIAVALGFLTPVALWIAFLMQLLQEGLLNCFGKTGHGTIPLLYAMLAFALAPCGRAVSVDALLRRGWRRLRGLPPAAPVRTSMHAHWPFEIVFVELAAYYFLAGFAKLASSGIAWADGHTLEYYLLEKATPAGLWLAERPELCAVLSFLVLRLRARLAAGRGVPAAAAAVLRRRCRVPPGHHRPAAHQLLAGVGAVRAVRSVVGAARARVRHPAETRPASVRAATARSPLTSRTPDQNVCARVREPFPPSASRRIESAA